MTHQEALFEYLLRLGDNALILGQRLSEWCGHAPVLEQDIAITNLALDQIGQARNWLTLAGEVEGKGRDEDQLAYLRDAWDFRNLLLVEQPNEDWAHTIVRQFLFDQFNYLLHNELQHSKDERIAAIAAKSLKEIKYHLKYSSEWMVRLGDGTEESHRRMQNALDALWRYSGEAFMTDEVDDLMAEAGIGPDLRQLKPLYDEYVAHVLDQATLDAPENTWMQRGGKQGTHTEFLGYILAEMQWMQRAYPNMTW